MLVRDEVFERLKKGEQLSKLRGEYRSSSQINEAAQAYLKWLEERIEEKRTEFAIIEENGAKQKDMFERLKDEAIKLGKNVDTLRSQEEQLDRKVGSSREELKELQLGIKELNQKGFTSEIVGKLANIGDKTGPEVWEIVQDYIKAQQLRQEIAANTKTLAQIEDRVGSLDRQKIDVKRSLTALQGKLEVLRTEFAAFEDLSQILNIAAQKGYSMETIEEVRIKLENPEIPKPLSSAMGKLLPVLASAQNLSGLVEQINLAETKLDTTLKSEAEAKIRIETLQNVTIRTIENVKNAGEKAVSDLTLNAESEIKITIADLQRQLEGITTNSQIILKNTSTELARLGEQKGQLKESILLGQIFFAFMESTDYLKRLEPFTVIQLLERIQLWIDLNCPGGSIRVNFNMASGELIAGNDATVIV
jgi:hypothetical protein